MDHETQAVIDPEIDTEILSRTADMPTPNPASTAGSPTSWGQTPQPRKESLYQSIRWAGIKSIPTPVLRFFTYPYIAGAHRSDALATARRLYERRGVHSTIDVLGESVTRPGETRAALDEYLRLMDDVGRCEYISISVKLSALGQGIDQQLCDENVAKLLRQADKHGLFVRFDMEDHTTIDATLATYKKFIGDFPRTGVVFQSMLFRTPADYTKLAHLRPNVRGVIGIYREPAEIAYTDKPTMKEKLLELIETMWANGSYVAIATHDRSVIRRALALADRMGKTPQDYEVQMLLGVPLYRFQDELVARGIKVRLYVPYGEQWAAYCRRRLNANPNMAALSLRNLFRFGQ